MRTLTVKQGGDFVDRFPPGWHTLEICKAEYGQFNDSKFIDLWFKEYEDVPKLSCRIWAKKGKTGEEFAIGRLFRFANAGIMEVAKSDTGEAIVKLNDDPNMLVGKSLNVFFYKDGDYYRILANTAPTVFENDLESFTEEYIRYWQGSAEKYYNDYVNKSKGSNDFVASETTSEASVSSDMPF